MVTTRDPPEGGWGWLVALGMCFNNILVDGVKYSFGMLFIDLLESFKRSRSYTSWILSIQIGFTLLPGPIVGALINRYDCRTVAAAGALLSAVGYVLSFFASSLVHLYITYGCIAGIGFGMFSLPFVVTLARYFDRRLTIAIGIGSMGSGIGIIVLNPVTKILLDEYAWRGTILLEAGILLNGILLAYFLRPLTVTRQNKAVDENNQEENTSMLTEPSLEDGKTTSCQNGNDVTNTELLSSSNRIIDIPECPGKTHFAYLMTSSSSSVNKNRSKTPDGAEIKHESKKRWLSIAPLKNMSFWFYLVSSVMFELSLYTPFTFVPDMMVEQGHRKQDAVWVMFMTGIASTFGRVAIGPIADLRCVNRVRICYIVTIMCGLAIGVAPFCSSLPTFITYGVVFGLLTGAACSVRGVVIPDLYGVEKVADFYGIQMFFVGIAAIIGLPIAGSIVDISGSYTVTMVVSAIEMAVGGVLVIAASVTAK